MVYRRTENKTLLENESPGTGIVLSLVMSIVCGGFAGTITVESTPGVGTSLNLEFKSDHTSTKNDK